MLPNQIFMIPLEYVNNITNSDTITNLGIEMYDDQHLKYDFTFLKIF